MLYIIYVILYFLLFCKCYAYEYNVTIVVASKYENLDWLKRLEGYEVKVYRPDNNSTGYFSGYEKGFEACMYLSYIINHYDRLSDYTIFLHGHESSWHSKNITHLIPRLDYSKIKYANLNYERYQTVIFDKRYLDLIKGLYNKSISRVTHYCCAQFVVSKERILRKTLDEYKAYDYWLQQTTEINHYTSRVFEYTWHFIFDEPLIQKRYTHEFCSLINCTPEEYKLKQITYTYYYFDGVKTKYSLL